MTRLDHFLVEESKRQISQDEKTFDLVINDVVDNLMDQVRVNPFLTEFTVHLVQRKDGSKLPHIVHHDTDPNRLLFYLTHYGLNKISSNALLRSNFDLDKVIKIVVVNKHFR